jgi:hypothetical protein
MISVAMYDTDKHIIMKPSKRKKGNTITEWYVWKHDAYKLTAADLDTNGIHGIRVEISVAALTWNNRDVN